MDRHDLLSSSICLFIALLIIIGSLSLLKIGTLLNPGPGLFPLLSGALFFVLSLPILIRAIVTKTSEKNSLSQLWAGLQWQNIFYTTAALLIYSIILDLTGFLLTTLFLFILMFRVMEPIKWKTLIGISIVASIISYVLFDRILQIPLPRGFLGF